MVPPVSLICELPGLADTPLKPQVLTLFAGLEIVICVGKLSVTAAAVNATPELLATVMRNLLISPGLIVAAVNCLLIEVVAITPEDQTKDADRSNISIAQRSATAGQMKLASFRASQLRLCASMPLIFSGRTAKFWTMLAIVDARSCDVFMAYACWSHWNGGYDSF